MRVSISIEPFIVSDISLLPQYLEEVVQLKAQIPQLSIHFDYFQERPQVLELVRSYAGQIDIYVHLMHNTLLDRHGFQVVSADVVDVAQLKLPAREGIVLDLGCDVAAHEQLIRQAQYITIMSVPCGKSGQVFHPEALTTVAQVRALNPQAILTLDGGINRDNIAMVKKAGVDIAVVGNYAKQCYLAGDFAAGINRLLRV